MKTPTMKRTTTALLVVSFLVPAGALAQQETDPAGVSRSFDQLYRSQTLKEGDVVWLRSDLDGSGVYSETKARLVGLTGATISVRLISLLPSQTVLDTGFMDEDGRIELPEHRVRQIDAEFADSLSNGVGFGALIGFLALGFPALIASTDCPGEGILAELCVDTGLAVALGAAGAGIGAAVGAAIDAGERSRVVLYAAPENRKGGFAFALSPIVDKRRRGLACVLRW